MSFVDVQIFDNTLKIKSKKATLAVDPQGKIIKFDADAILATEGNYDTSRINNFRLLIERPGEYEVSGIKISVQDFGNGTIFSLNSENVNILLAKASAIESASADKIGDYQIAIIKADKLPNQSVITALEPHIIVLYGENAKGAAKNLGKETVSASSKVSFPEDKLPEELEVFILG